MGFIPNKENILTYWKIICESTPKSEIFKYIGRRLIGKRKDFDTDVYITNDGGKFNCGRKMNTCTVCCSIFEEELAPVFGDLNVAVDIGANVGKHSIALAKHSQKVIAIEPDHDSFVLLEENVKLNNLQEKVILINKAVAEKEGVVTFYRDSVILHLIQYL